MGNTDPKKTKAGNKYELGGRHSNPVVTTPTIALDFSGTTQQSASHNVASNQISPGSIHAAGNFLEAEICYNIANILAQSHHRHANPTARSIIQSYTSTQALTTKNRAQLQEMLTQKLTLAEERKHRLLSKASNSSSFAFPLQAQLQRFKRIANERANQGESSATKIVKNKGWMRQEMAIEHDGEHRSLSAAILSFPFVTFSSNDQTTIARKPPNDTVPTQVTPSSDARAGSKSIKRCFKEVK
ncbi:hypothetical protein F511_00841 [Dorcoceras hygrometricum]|nr:hypothetical protein F511_00841 [Dorcoceras hygrometricum]